MKISYEETFGPGAPLFRFENRGTEVIRLANDTTWPRGDTSTPATLGRVFRVAEALEVGLIALTTA
jgi:succinate-semialdehyde dehydrogenase/glutarate-semialdehyde dehydrogenase